MSDESSAWHEFLSETIRLNAGYARLIDARRAEEWSRLFAEDGVLALTDRDITGRAELAAFAAGSPVGTHVSGAPTVELQDDGSIRSEASFVFVNPTARRVVTGSYDDLIVRTDEGFVFARRRIDAHGAMDL